ncbi:RNA polymerase factor sigma-54 [Granulicella sibirica]|uniref:RNA polymerase sigma-54 factor RpoN n=1 Tax=Granulicella sibirica TaxID=2479048 RepID=A0A4Q0T3E2_9BACT|nr:RNA polymerase factor sigma-54 [Granulicella sibirica]RXH57000.1 RNA polymerase sigma-54 factor RpoN [Granulicella sibirica]
MLQPKLNLRVSQRQVLTPGLVQMVSVLALNKLELKEMLNNEMIENPVLEELEEISVSLDERTGIEGDRERSAEDVAAETERVEKDPFDEIDFGSYFQDYLDPGFKTASNFEESDKPSFEHFLSQPSTLSDHLGWQLGALTLTPGVKAAADLVVGNLNENGYLTASDEEMAEALLIAGRISLTTGPDEFEAARAKALADVIAARELVNQLDPVGVAARDLKECLIIQICAQRREAEMTLARRQREESKKKAGSNGSSSNGASSNGASSNGAFSKKTRWDDPDEYAEIPEPKGRVSVDRTDTFSVAENIVTNFLGLLQKKDMRELTKSCGRSADEVQAAVDFIRTLDPRPGQRYNQSETRLIEPDVAFVKRDDVYVVVVNEDDLPTLRLNQGYRKMLRQKQTEKEVREYVKERYKSAIQLLRNIEQRKNTIVRTCEVILRRQQEFLEKGESGLKPMMIKEVAEELGVHPSTVSRAVSNKYVHTHQGVYELRFFFSEGVGGPEGGDLPLVLLKRKVKQMIEAEDSRKPLTDDQLAAQLQREGIQVTRRTVAKYREDLQIPSTHQRRVR